MTRFGYDIAIAEIERIQNGMVNVRENNEDDAEKVAIMILDAKEKNVSSYKKAFYKKSRVFHPDKFLPSCSNISSKIFVLIKEAKEYLCNENQQKKQTPEGTYKTDFERLIKGYSKRTLMWETPEEREVRVSLELDEIKNKASSLKRKQEAKRKVESLKRHQEAKRKAESLKRHQEAKEKESMEKRASEKEPNIRTSVVDSLDLKRKADLMRRQKIESLERKRNVAEKMKADSLERKRRIESLDRKTIVAERMKADSLERKQKMELLDKKAIVAERILREKQIHLNSEPMDVVSPTTVIKTVRKNVKTRNKKQTQKNFTRLKRIEQVMKKRGIIM